MKTEFAASRYAVRKSLPDLPLKNSSATSLKVRTRFTANIGEVVEPSFPLTPTVLFRGSRNSLGRAFARLLDAPSANQNSYHRTSPRRKRLIRPPSSPELAQPLVRRD